MISVRRSDAIEIDRIMEVYENAIHFMRSRGNLSQWTGGYPGKDVILRDISDGNHYLAEDEDGNILMVFSFIIGPDPAYGNIEHGAWLNDYPYGTIHRIASSGLEKGMLKACVRFCGQFIDNIRVDTHSDNGPMQNALHSLGFCNCGVIHLADGSPRLAFQKELRPEIGQFEIKF